MSSKVRNFFVEAVFGLWPNGGHARGNRHIKMRRTAAFEDGLDVFPNICRHGVCRLRRARLNSNKQQRK